MAETNTGTNTETTEKVHSKKFDSLKKKWEMDYITKDTLKGWVALNEKRAGRASQQRNTRKLLAKSMKPVKNNDAD